MVRNKEIDIISKFQSLAKHNVPGDFRFIIIDRVLTIDTELTTYEKFIMNAYEVVKTFSLSSADSNGFDTSNVVIEQVPLGLGTVKEFGFNRL